MADATKLSGVALVTGAASGIGRATAAAFANAGCCKLGLIDMNLDGLKQTLGMIGSREGLEVHLFDCDISSSSNVTETFAKIHADLGRIDYVVNCAGVNTNYQASVDCPIEEFDRITSINYRGLWLCSREELKIMKSQSLDCEQYTGIPEARAQRGAIVNIASGLGIVAMPASPAYCGSKAGVISITRCDAVDYSPFRIRVNCLLPGVVETPMTTSNPQIKAALDTIVVPTVPMRRFGQPEEIADAALFLCSNRASYIQGAGLPVDGGYVSV